VSRPALVGASAALEALSREGRQGWSQTPGRDALAKTFRFASFSAAFGWMTRIALAAEAHDHHPEWSNVYDRVDVVLSTHDVGGVTDLDLLLARVMEAAAAG
jgi:4a-hydroxytetrahydrobiopterin dehydratase